MGHGVATPESACKSKSPGNQTRPFVCGPSQLGRFPVGQELSLSTIQCTYLLMYLCNEAGCWVSCAAKADQIYFGGFKI